MTEIDKRLSREIVLKAAPQSLLNPTGHTGAAPRGAADNPSAVPVLGNHAILTALGNWLGLLAKRVARLKVRL